MTAINGVSTDSVLSSQEITLLIKDRYSYGTLLDKKITQHKPNVYKSTIGNNAMLKILQHNRVDYFFISHEEADSLIESSAIPRKNFKYIDFSDIPIGEKNIFFVVNRLAMTLLKDLMRHFHKYANLSLQ